MSTPSASSRVDLDSEEYRRLVEVSAMIRHAVDPDGTTALLAKLDGRGAEYVVEHIRKRLAEIDAEAARDRLADSAGALRGSLDDLEAAGKGGHPLAHEAKRVLGHMAAVSEVAR